MESLISCRDNRVRDIVHPRYSQLLALRLLETVQVVRSAPTNEEMPGLQSTVLPFARNNVTPVSLR
jgi:hypothetical protein